MTCPYKNCDSDGAIPGSVGPAPFNRWEIAGVIASPICLLPMITEFSRDCLELYSHYKNGLLLEAGGLINQRRIYLQAMGLINAESSSH